MRGKPLKGAALVAIAGVLLQFGGCLQLFGREVVVGAGRMVGESPGSLVSAHVYTPLPDLTELLDQPAG